MENGSFLQIHQLERRTKTEVKKGIYKKKEALSWEREFLQQKTTDLDMTFESFTDIYMNNMKGRLKENTFRAKRYVIDDKILPYFKNKSMSEIKPSDIISWQNVIVYIAHPKSGV